MRKVNKIVVIGDVHARSSWKDILKKESGYDLVIFLGDYLDPYNSELKLPEIQLGNLLEILELKVKYPHKVVLLIGNHDFHYTKKSTTECSRYSYEIAKEAGILFDTAIHENIMSVCYHYDDILFTHAGITKTWCMNWGVDAENPEYDIEDICREVNDTFTKNSWAFHFLKGANYSGYGDDITQSPIWVRPNSLVHDRIDNYRQVVGHTGVMKITELPGKAKGIWLCDGLGEEQVLYLVIKDGVMIPSQLY